MDHLAAHIGQTEVPPLVLEREPFVVDAEQMHQGRLDVEHVDRILGNVVTKGTGLSVIDASLHATPGHPHRKAAGMVVATKIVVTEFSLAIISTAKFAPPHHKRILEQPALFEVGE